MLQSIVYNNAVNCSGSRSFPAYKEPLSHFYYIRHISPKLLVLWFQVMIIIPLRSALAFAKYLYFQTEALFRLDRGNSITF